MPYPLAAAALVASAVGTGASMVGQAQARSAQKDAANAELARQRAFQQEAIATVAENLSKSGRDTADAELKQGATDRLAAYDRVGAGAGTTSKPAATDRTVTTPIGKASATASKVGNAWSAMAANSRAKLGSYGDWGLKQNVRDARTSQKLAITGTNARNSANVLPMELNDASHAGDGTAMLGGVLSLAGSVGGMAAATSAPSSSNAWGKYTIGPTGELIAKRSPAQAAEFSRLQQLYQ